MSTELDEEILLSPWQGYLIDLIKFAGENPWKFVYYTMLALSPFFALSAYLSHRLIQEIDNKEKIDGKAKAKDSNRIKVNRKNKNQ